jgi:membrane protein
MTLCESFRFKSTGRCSSVVKVLSEGWQLLKDTVVSFVDDDALSRGAAIAFYTVTSIAPLLLIVIAIAGLAFGRDAALNAIISQLSGLMGEQTAEVLQSAVASAAGNHRASWRRSLGSSL